MDYKSEQNPGSSFTTTADNMNTRSCPVRGTQEKIEALKRAVFNLKLERFLLQEELKKTTGRQYNQDNEDLLQSLKEHQQKYDRLLRELQDKSEALKNALTTIEYHKKFEQLLRDTHAAEFQNYQNTVLLLESKITQREDNLRLFHLKKQKKLIRKLKESSFNCAGGEYAEIIALPGRTMTTRFSAYRKKLFRVKLISMAAAAEQTNIATNFEEHITKLHEHEHVISNNLLLMILKWVVLRHSVKQECDFHLDVIFTKDALENMASIEVVGTETGTATEPAAIATANTATIVKNSDDNKAYKSKLGTVRSLDSSSDAYVKERKKNNRTNYEPSPSIHEATELKLSPVHLIKLIFMPFGCPFRQ